TAPVLHLPGDLNVTAGNNRSRDDNHDWWHDWQHWRGDDDRGHWAGFFGIAFAYGRDSDRTSWNTSQNATPLTRVSWSAYATDAVDLLDPVTCSPASGTQFPVGTTTVNCSATDRAGNTATGSFAVNVTYDWTGLQSPFKNGAATVKAGKSVDLRFSLE